MRTIAIIARFFGGVIAMGLLYNLYYLYLDGTLMARPRRFTFCGAAGAASGDAAQAATPPVRFWRLSLDEDAREALRLPDWAVVCVFLVLRAAFWPPR
jgi:hypothetical protein